MSHWRILFVDDDELILRMGGVTLRRLGHEAEGFSHPDAALEAFRKASSPYDLVLCDVRLGTDSGFDLARQLRSVDPAVRVLMVSGSVEAGDAARARALGALGPLPKAQVMTDLPGTLRRFLGGPAAA